MCLVFSKLLLFCVTYKENKWMFSPLGAKTVKHQRIKTPGTCTCQSTLPFPNMCEMLPQGGSVVQWLGPWIEP